MFAESKPINISKLLIEYGVRIMTLVDRTNCAADSASTALSIAKRVQTVGEERQFFLKMVQLQTFDRI